MDVAKQERRSGAKENPGCKPAKSFRQVAAIKQLSHPKLRF
jgi:hypothetical protein